MLGGVGWGLLRAVNGILVSFADISPPIRAVFFEVVKSSFDTVVAGKAVAINSNGHFLESAREMDNLHGFISFIKRKGAGINIARDIMRVHF